MPVASIDHVTTPVTPVSEANADFPMTKVSATDALHASVIVHTTIRTIPAHSCAEGTTGSHGLQTLQEYGNHKYVEGQFHTKEMAHDLMANPICIRILMILNLSTFQTVREKLTMMLRPMKLVAWGWDSGGGSAAAGYPTNANWF